MNKIKDIISYIVFAYMVLCIINFSICGQMAMSQPTELASWNFLKYIINYYGIVC